MKNFSFNVSNEVLELGVKVVCAHLYNVQISERSEELNQYIVNELESFKQLNLEKNYKDEMILIGFRNLHSKVGRSNKDYVASPEMLRKQFFTKERFPRINNLVDIYNLFSVKSGLALGAHDISKINGNISLKLTNGSENFIPLGKINPEKIYANEYSYIDDSNNIICRLEVVQCEQTKVTKKSNDIFLIIQGNENSEQDFILSIANQTCQTINKFCGGEYTLL